MEQHCSECGKILRNGTKAIGITGGYMDYKNLAGFGPDDSGWISLFCIPCARKKKW